MLGHRNDASRRHPQKAQGGRVMMTMVKGVALRLVFMLALVVAGTTLARAETIAQLYEKAKAEKSMAFYSGGPVEPWERWAKEFQQQFPGLTVSVTGGYSNVLDEKINQQL